MRKKYHTPELDKEKVNLILAKAFEANNLEANKIPLEILESYSNYRKERFLLQRGILVIVLIAFMLMPLLFITPGVAMQQGKDVGCGRPSYDVEVDSSLPIVRVNAQIDGVNMPVYEVGENRYSVRPSRNGEMTVSVTLLNDQTTTVTQTVTQVDTDPPVMLENNIEDGKLVFYVADYGLGMRYEVAYALTESGERLEPIAMDETAGKVYFEYPKETINVFFEDKVGNVLQLVVVLGQGD